jgi:DNA-binding NarL/FixJ family response regulator
MPELAVVIVEDNKETREALEQKVNACDGLKVSAAYPNFTSARLGLAESTPDILLTDLDLPDGSGIDIIGEQSGKHPDLPIMVISVFGDESHVIEAIQAGARGYLLKDSDSDEINDAIQQLIEGGSPITPSIARHLIKRFHSSAAPTTEPGDSNTLSEREHEVLILASKGFSYTETAEMLNISVNTVASYTKRIYGKLAVSSRSEAIYEATRMGIMTSDEDGPYFRRREDRGLES